MALGLILYFALRGKGGGGDGGDGEKAVAADTFFKSDALVDPSGGQNLQSSYVTTLGEGEDQRNLMSSPFGGALYSRLDKDGKTIYYNSDPVLNSGAEIVSTNKLANGNVYFPLKTEN